MAKAETELADYLRERRAELDAEITLIEEMIRVRLIVVAREGGALTADRAFRALTSAVTLMRQHRERLAGSDPCRAKLEAVMEAHLGPMQAGECDDAECMICGAFLCPHNELLHLHHDGCPACD